MTNVINIPQSVKIRDAIVYSVIATPNIPNKDRLIAIITNQKIDNLSIIINNITYTTNCYSNTSSPYGKMTVYTFKPDESIFTLLNDNKKVTCKLSSINEKEIIPHTAETTIVNNQLSCNKKQTMIESLNSIFFEDSKVLENIVLAVLFWIEYNLAIGVDQVFINQSIYLTQTNANGREFWCKILEPYINHGEVVLCMYENKITRYEYQGAIQNIILWLNKNRTTWFATHDFDEFICPCNGEWKNDIMNKQIIKTILNSLPTEVNYIETKMIRCDIPNNTHVYINPTKIDKDYARSWHKFIVKMDVVNTLWVHQPTNWVIPRKNSEMVLRINHYEVSTKKAIHNNHPSIPYDGLKNERLHVENLLNSRFGGDYITFIQKCIDFINNKH